MVQFTLLLILIVLQMLSFSLCQSQDFHNSPVIGVMTMHGKFGPLDENGRFHTYEGETPSTEERKLYYSMYTSYKK